MAYMEAMFYQLLISDNILISININSPILSSCGEKNSDIDEDS